MRKITVIATACLATVFLTACDEDEYREDATQICQAYSNAINGIVPWSDIYAAQYGRAGQDADLTGEGFINIFEARAFCEDLQAQGYTLGGGGGGGGGTTTSPNLQINQH